MITFMSEALSGIDTTTPSVARGYDHWLGGKDNFEVDRQVLAAVEAIVPQARPLAVENREWLIRVTRFLADAAGIDQFLDLGCGLPTMRNVHQVAQHHNAEAVVVYADNDPTVAAHGRALLEDSDRTHFCVQDLRYPDQLLADPAVSKHLDFNRPIALIQSGTLHHVADEYDPAAIMRRYIELLPAGSYVAISHFSWPPGEEQYRELATTIQSTLQELVGSCWWRSNEEIISFFGGLELIEPGLVRTVDWWPDGPPSRPEITNLIYGGVAHKP